MVAVAAAGRRVTVGRVTTAAVAEGVLLGLLVLLPSLVNPAAVAAFEPLKASVLRAAAVIAVAVYAPRWPHTGIERAGIAVVALACVSTIFSAQPLIGLMGSFDRDMGLLSLAAGLAIMLVGADLWRDPARRERAITALLLGAVVPCAYAFAQRLNLDPIPWSTLGAPGSTLGSPTFLAGYLVVLVPFGLYRVLAGAQRMIDGDWTSTVRYAGWLALLLMIGATVAQSTIRGAILGMVAGTAVFALQRGRPNKAAVAGAAAFIAVALAVAVAFTGGAGVTGFTRFTRVATGGDSSSERLVVWRDALTLPLGDPVRALVGFGPEMQSRALERAEATVRLTQNQQWDRVHNIFLDTWVTGGLAGAVSLLILLVLAIRSLVRAEQSLLRAAVLAALVGHLVEVSFAFHTVVTGALFWVLPGLAASLAVRQPSPARRAAAWPRVLVAALLLPIAVAPAVGDALYGAGRQASQQGDPRTAATLDEAAAAALPWVEEPIRAAGLAWQQLAVRRGDADAVSNAERDLLEAARRGAGEPTPYVRLLRLYLSREQLDAAEQECQRALGAGPYRATVWDACADVSSRRGVVPDAQARRARADELRHPLP